MCFLGKEDTCSPALTQVTAAWKTPPQNKDQNFPLVLSFIPMLCKLLSLLFLLDETAVILSERILCVGKGSVNIPSIIICVNMNFTAFLGFITIVRASLNQTPQQAAQRYYRSSWIKTLICTSLSPSCSSTPQILAIDLVQTLVIDLVDYLCLLQTLFLWPSLQLNTSSQILCSLPSSILPHTWTTNSIKLDCWVRVPLMLSLPATCPYSSGFLPSTEERGLVMALLQRKSIHLSYFPALVKLSI